MHRLPTALLNTQTHNTGALILSGEQLFNLGHIWPIMNISHMLPNVNSKLVDYGKIFTPMKKGRFPWITTTD